MLGMTNDAFIALKSKVLQNLDEKLDPLLTYHSRKHTEDVLLHTERIALAENIGDTHLLSLMKVAALFHDTGFMDVYAGHEERSCEIMSSTLKNSEFEQSEILLMSNMIMATKVPQSPVELYEKILCDADLDYLGRYDFPDITKKLRNELFAFGFIGNLDEWNELQVNFLRNHRYFTNSSASLREPVKRSHLSMLLRNIETEKP